MSIQCLISANCEALLSLKRQLSSCTNTLFTQKSKCANYPISAHVRHIVEHYQVLLQQFTTGVVCYDKRQRDTTIEQSIDVAITIIDKTISHLNSLSALQNKNLQLQAILCGQTAITAEVRTTLGRELQFVQSHTLHHQALIGCILMSEGVKISEDFGVAPATIQHRKTEQHQKDSVMN